MGRGSRGTPTQEGRRGRSSRGTPTQAHYSRRKSHVFLTGTLHEMKVTLTSHVVAVELVGTLQIPSCCWSGYPPT